MAAFVALHKLLKRKRRRRAARAAEALQPVGGNGDGADGLGHSMATLGGGAGSRDLAAAERTIRTPYQRLDSGGSAGRTPGAARYQRLGSGKSAGGERGDLADRLDSGRSSSGLTDALLSPDHARRAQHARQGRFNSVARSVLFGLPLHQPWKPCILPQLHLVTVWDSQKAFR